MKQKGEETASPTNPEEGRSGNFKTKNAGRTSDAPTRAGKTCLFNGPGQSSKECKVLKIYSKKCAAQRPHKTAEAPSCSKPKRDKVVKFNDSTQEFNTMGNHGDPIPRKKKGLKVVTKKCNTKSVKAAAV